MHQSNQAYSIERLVAAMHVVCSDIESNSAMFVDIGIYLSFNGQNALPEHDSTARTPCAGSSPDDTPPPARMYPQA